MNLSQQTDLDRLRFRSMMPREILILKAWLKDNLSKYDRAEFDVRVGTGTDPGPTFSQEMRSMWTRLTMQRIDALLWSGDEATIVEVKDRADGAAIGQLLLYGQLLQATYPSKPKPKLLLLANSSQSDLHAALQTAGATMELIPVNFSQLY